MGGLSDAQVRMFAERRAEHDRLVPGYGEEFLRLERLLLVGGGSTAVPPVVPDRLAGVLVARGGTFPTAGALLVPMRRSDCHANAWELAAAGTTPDGTPVSGWASGYALSDDGLWRQHSWAMSGARVVETTLPRVGYFGVALECSAGI